MAFGVDDAIALGGGIASGVGSAISGNQSAAAQTDATRSQAHIAQQQMMAQIAEWRRQQALAEAGQAQSTQRHMQQNPMRDQLYATLRARMGVPQTQLNYGQNPNGPSAQPTADRYGMLNQRMLNYRPGDGGVSSGVDQQVLNNLGYGNNGTKDMYHNDPQAQGKDTNQWLGNYLAQFLGNSPQSIGSMPNFGGAPTTGAGAPTNPALGWQGFQPTQGAAPGGIGGAIGPRQPQQFNGFIVPPQQRGF